MKRKKKSYGFSSLAITFIGVLLGMICGYFIIGTGQDIYDSHYDVLAVCTETDWNEKIATFCDNNGEVWEWNLDHDSWIIKENKAYRLTINTNGTETIYDDCIEKISEK